MKLTPHEQKILKIVQDNPGIINDPAKRETVAKKNGLTEKTLRNRIAELKKRDLIKKPLSKLKRNKKPLITENDEINLKEIWNIFFNNKSLVMKVALVCTTIGLSYSLLATIYFESRISLYPAGELSQTSGVLGDFQGLAKSFGLGGLASAPTYNIPDIIKSRSLKKNIVLRSWKTQEFPNGSNLIICFHPLFIADPKTNETDQRINKYIIRCLKNNINVYCIHTNLDNNPFIET